MKNASTLLALVLFLTPAFGLGLECFDNQGGTKVKKICPLNNKKGEVNGFVLYNSDESRTYLTVSNRTVKNYSSNSGYDSTREVRYTVQSANSDLEAQDFNTSVITYLVNVDYSEISQYLVGETPNGHKISALVTTGDSVIDWNYEQN